MAFNWESMLGGAGSGALAGSAFGPKGAIAGGVIGGVGGLLMGNARDDAQAKQQAALEAAMQRLQVMRKEQYARRQQDLDKILSFYGPAQDRLNSMYGGGSSAPGFNVNSLPFPTAPRRF